MKNAIVMLIVMTMFVGCSSYQKTAYIHETGKGANTTAYQVITLEDGETYKIFRASGSNYLNVAGRFMAIKVKNRQVPSTHVFSKSGGIVPERRRKNETSYRVDGHNVIYVSKYEEGDQKFIKVRSVVGIALIPIKS